MAVSAIAITLCLGNREGHLGKERGESDAETGHIEVDKINTAKGVQYGLVREGVEVGS